MRNGSAAPPFYQMQNGNGEMDDKDQDPLEAEARKREEWRGDDAPLGEADAPGHTLPASEADSAAQNSGGRGKMRTISPPD